MGKYASVMKIQESNEQDANDQEDGVFGNMSHELYLLYARLFHKYVDLLEKAHDGHKLTLGEHIKLYKLEHYFEKKKLTPEQIECLLMTGQQLKSEGQLV